MNFKQIGVLLSVSTIVGINMIANKALAQHSPSIFFERVIGSGGCIVEGQLLGPDGRSLSIILNNMNASNGQRQRCILRINTIIPSGFNVQNVQILYQGSTDVDSGSRGTSLSRGYIFTGGGLGIASAPPKTTQFVASNPLFQEQDDLIVGSASCGGQGQLGINLIAQSSLGSFIVVDSADLNAGSVIFRINLRPC
ncbi:DUF4360 domain-containing protein [Nostoc sp. CHAB 5836]|uniref:DUF4360 domain-containing protein n=1 Tax=Nostoc sp. CHAB 5836 TaxID=2780404 RepID=UPI001E4A4871|nr:DUF4360 domain-containing protein [Nostoc sp. CHAB 5836]MCC5617440.1 DUF4360 domain-containing protein [Nostoc sp. CHAB 5836]